MRLVPGRGARASRIGSPGAPRRRHPQPPNIRLDGEPDPPRTPSLALGPMTRVGGPARRRRSGTKPSGARPLWTRSGSTSTRCSPPTSPEVPPERSPPCSFHLARTPSDACSFSESETAPRPPGGSPVPRSAAQPAGATRWCTRSARPPAQPPHGIRRGRRPRLLGLAAVDPARSGRRRRSGADGRGHRHDGRRGGLARGDPGSRTARRPRTGGDALEHEEPRLGGRAGEDRRSPVRCRGDGCGTSGPCAATASAASSPSGRAPPRPPRLVEPPPRAGGARRPTLRGSCSWARASRSTPADSR